MKPILKNSIKKQRPRVYIVNKGCHDYSLASDFGDLVFLSDGSFSRFSTSRMFRVLSSALKDSKPEDFILISGLTIMSSVACSIFARKHGRVNLLLYNNGPKKTPHYVSRTIVLEEL